MPSLKAEVAKLKRDIGGIRKPITDPEQLREWFKCKEDPIYFICTYVQTYDPRVSPPYMPFQLFPKQQEFISWLGERYLNREDGVAEKSRDVGFTWCCVAFLIHKWLFERGFKGTVGSRKQDLVDKLGDPDSIFEKMRMILTRLPVFLKPRSYRDNFCKLINNDNGAVITGEAGDNMGRGGRSSMYILDEFAHIERAAKVDAAVSANCDCKIYVSTPQGMGNLFYQKRINTAYPLFTLHWRDDPRKTQEWYERQKATLDPIILAQEVDIDYSASQINVVIPQIHVTAATGYELRGSGHRSAGLDVAGMGSNLNVMVIRQGSRVLSVHSWKGENTTQTAYRAIELAKQHQVKHICFDAIGVGEGVGATFAESKQLMGDITYTAVKSGSSPSDAYWSAEHRTSKDKFRNLKAEMWFLLRNRFRNTYEMTQGIRQYPDSELISIPPDNILARQLSVPTFRFTETGKIQIEGKEELRKRGIESPDHADALALAFANDLHSKWTTTTYHTAR